MRQVSMMYFILLDICQILFHYLVILVGTKTQIPYKNICIALYFKTVTDFNSLKSNYK